MKNIKKYFVLSASFLSAFLVLTLAVLFVDVQKIGPEGSKIGLASVNQAVNELFGSSAFWYDVTKIFGYLAMATACVFALVGLYQLITRKSLKKIDGDLYALAGLYALTLAAYVLFELVVVNYRPVLMEGALEASFPSSHTMLTVCFLSGAVWQIRKRVKNNALRVALETLCVAVITLTVSGRLLSGVHWFTDIVAGVLLGLAIVFLYVAVAKKIEK